jgi:hypothetical protein
MKVREEKRSREEEEKSEEKKVRAAQPSLPIPYSPQLTERDYAALEWLVEQRAATVTQLTTLLGYLGDGPISDRRGTMLITRWEDLGLVERRTIWHRRPAVVLPTSSCTKLFGLVRWRKPAIGILNHTIRTAQIRLQVCRPGSNRGWMTEAQLREILPPGTRIPDGAIVEIDGGLTAVETELTSHGRRRVREAMTSLLAARTGNKDTFHHVLYLCSPETTVQVTAVRDELPTLARRRVAVLPCPE